VGKIKHEEEAVEEEWERRSSFHFCKIENNEEKVHELYLNASY